MVENLYVGVDKIGIDGELSNFAMFKLLFLRENIQADLTLCASSYELENVYNEFMQEYIYHLHMYLDYYCNENCMMLDFISTYDCIVDGKYSININKNLYDVYRDFEFAKSKRNVFVKIYRKIREMI